MTVWDAGQHLFFVDVSFRGVEIGPGAGRFRKEAQVRIGVKDNVPAAWDPSNDWSYQSLSTNRDQLAKTPFVPVYEFGSKLLSGQLPSSQGAPPPPAPPPNPTPPPVSTNAQFILRDDWGAGFVADMKITNGGTTALSSWVLEFDFARVITSIWNAEIVSHVGDHYVIRNAPWNGTIAAGSAVSFGFQGGPGNVTGGPTNFKLNGVPLG